jgi:hypothetical protein
MPASLAGVAFAEKWRLLWKNLPFDQSGQGDIHGTRYR